MKGEMEMENLDAMSIEDLELAEKCFRTLATYAGVKIEAIRNRIEGDIKKALVQEQFCDQLYASLPEEYRW